MRARILRALARHRALITWLVIAAVVYALLRDPVLFAIASAAVILAAAQVHATLALAAATWDVGSSAAADEPLHRAEWSEVTR